MARDFVWIATSRSGPSACNRRRHHPGWNRCSSERLRPLESTQNKYLGPRCHTAIENRQQNRKKKARTQASILLLNFHPNLLRISITVISKRRQFFFRAFSSSSLESSDQYLVWYVPLKVTCKKCYIISTQPNSLTKSWCTNKNLISKLPRKTSKPRTKQIRYTRRWLNTKSDILHSKWTLRYGIQR